MSTWLDALPSLHFVRPAWLWALLLVPLAAWWWQRRQRRASVWHTLVDPHLLPHLLDSIGTHRSRFALVAGLLALTLAIVALAGPAWRKVEHPLWQTRAPLVIALDLSSAMLANDLPPNRLAHARAKLAALLRERTGGQVGLVAYAGDAFTVAPLTDDAGNVALFIDALQPDVVPVDGQRSDRALAWSAQLLERAGFDQGQILLLTDHADGDARAAASRAAADGYTVSVLGVGSESGAAYRDAQGRIGQARLDPASLRALADAGGGRYIAMTSDSADLQALDVLDPQQTDGGLSRGKAGASWRDEGYWLLPPLLLLAVFAFRRGGTALAAVLLCVALPVLPVRAGGVRAAEVPPADEGTAWRRPDQVAHARMERGADAYRRSEFEQAAQAYAKVDTADGHYNRGNALAKAGEYTAAIAAYDQALHRQPGMADAIANKQAVEALLKRKPPQGGQQPNQTPKQGDDPKPGSAGAPGDKGAQAQDQTGDAQRNASQPQSQQAPAKKQPAPAQPEKAVDPEAQQAADAAQRERMARALQQAGQEPQPQDKPAQAGKPARVETPAERERRLANEAWLKRVPDDPGGLLRAKFRLEHERRQRQGSE